MTTSEQRRSGTPPAECAGCVEARGRIAGLRLALDEARQRRPEARPVDLARARKAAQRLTDVAFKNRDRETGELIRPHFEIPANPNDDDIILTRALDELERLRKAAGPSSCEAPDESTIEAAIVASVDMDDKTVRLRFAGADEVAMRRWARCLGKTVLITATPFTRPAGEKP